MRLRMLVAVLVSLGMSFSRVQAKEDLIKFSHVVAPGSPKGKAADLSYLFHHQSYW